MKKWGTGILLGLAVVAAGGVPAASAQAVQVGLGDPSRAQLLDTLRSAIAEDLKQPVKFVVREMRTYRGWAFVTASPRTPAGAEIDFGKTHYAEQQEAGVLDGDTVYALLRQERGTWRVVTFVIGPTDVAWEAWPDEHGAPKQLFAR
ncbi:hypothetical protein [Sphingomonas sp. G-3-2-10]|uniref:hypothetical protein n=1 Tax=Sphingomonas sp. G-3-2-10 TaxID=2728838 RepID=UPI00146D2CA8|nr:hypothetical protein [Sphingomonas sp. G-3-2-10]NML06168.1 hypothetical protein [Sphingomonas sp. G-3-2-10]